MMNAIYGIRISPLQGSAILQFDQTFQVWQMKPAPSGLLLFGAEKAASNLTSEDMGQVLNYLKATGCRLVILLNFGARSLMYKRVIMSDNNKKES